MQKNLPLIPRWTSKYGVNPLHDLSTLFLLIAFGIAEQAFGAGTDAEFKIIAGHPRTYLTAERLEKIRLAASGNQPRSNSTFPLNTGTLVFDIKPAPYITSKHKQNTEVFDSFDNDRNHIFIRHSDQIDPETGLTACSTRPNDERTLCMQIALQSSKGFYAASLNFTLAANQWQQLSVSWNTDKRWAAVKVGQAVAQLLKWNTSGNGRAGNWQPDQQNFVFSDRDSIDHVRLYSAESPDNNALISDFSADITEGSSIDKNASFRTTTNTSLVDIWRQFYRHASTLARQINEGKIELKAEEGRPENAKVLSLAYLVTGDKQFLNAAMIYADRLLAVPSTSGDDYFQCLRVEAMGELYDWLYSEMHHRSPRSGRTYGQDLAERMMQTIRLQSDFICGRDNALTQDWRCQNPAHPDALSGHSFYNNTQISVAALAIADEYPELNNLLATEFNNFKTLYKPVRDWLSVDGGSHMGWGYGAGYSSLDPFILWENALPHPSPLKADWQGKLIDRFIYGLRGDLSFPTSGDTLNVPVWHNTVTTFALKAATDFGNAKAQNFYRRWIQPSMDKGVYRLPELLYWEPDLPDTPIEQLEFSKWFRNAGQVLMRDTWDYPKATLLEFKSSSFSSLNHHHLDQNAFTVFYKAPLLVDSGVYDQYNSEHWRNYFIRTVAHNTLTIWDPTENFGKVRQFNISNDGGQQIMPAHEPTLMQIQEGGVNHLDGIVRYEYSPELTYVEGNASKAYSATKLDQNEGYRRSIVYLRKPEFWTYPIIVVFDKITAQADKAGLQKRFLLHSVHEPEPLGGQNIAPGQYLVNGNQLTIRNGQGMLSAQTLLPENPVIKKIGGEGPSGDYRFMVETLDGSGQYQYKNYPPQIKTGREVTTDMGAWRIEISAPTPSRQEYFLHVFSLADNRPSSTPPTAQNLSSDSAAVALLANRQLLVFNKGNQKAEELAWEMPDIPAKLFAVGLQPDTSYIVSKAPIANKAGYCRVALTKTVLSGSKSSLQGSLSFDFTAR